MELRPFKELIGLTKEKLDQAMAPIRARQVKAQAELQMTQIDSQIIHLETQVQELCTQKEIPLARVLDYLDELDLLERRRNQYAQVLSQLFPETAEAAA